MQLDACWETNEILIKQPFLLHGLCHYISLVNFLVLYYVMSCAI